MCALHRRASQGFTTIELMVVVAILAILAALAAPSFQFLVERWRVLQAVETLKTTLYYARSEAIKRGNDVYIEKLPKAQVAGCISDDTNQDWDCGWVIFIDANGNQSWNSGEEIRRFDIPKGITVSRTESGKTITISRWGTMNGASLLGFSIAPKGGLSDPSTKGVCMAAGGRIRVINQENVPCV
ncbi:MAG: prepilin-type N-terminal cleavage/methylation domain-containing protein [Alcaligenaceae bacterium]|nr:MAG: prepilin-type N-terminal cleavage/methylation domain-containing protein [Alcaligenaceae bacterium]